LLDEQESPIDQDCRLAIGVSWAVKLMTNLFPPLGSRGVQQRECPRFPLHLTRASFLFKRQDVLPKCSLWTGFKLRVRVWAAFFICKPSDDRQVIIASTTS